MATTPPHQHRHIPHHYTTGNIMQLLTAKFNQIATEIDNTTAQITALQGKLSELQEHQQQLLSVEQACQSALSQVDTALMMLHHVDPSEIKTFKDALTVKFTTDAIAQIEPTAPAETDTAPTEPIEPTPPDTNPVIDIEVTPATDTPATETDTATDTDTTVNTDIEKSLDSLSLKSFRKLARSKNLDSRLNRQTLTARLKAITTKDEVLAVS
ncbi:hypothetical protein QUA07_27955 [Microcoleus sp. T3_A4]|uniref:hypothetical protein n=1 Tax=Microcoleus sp. T3_A4 TaxID=2818968 RepID=UPI002FCFE82D